MSKLRQREVRFASILTVYAPDANALIDMMRYDRCRPLHARDAEKVVRLIGPRPDEGRRPQDKIVQLFRTSANSDDPSERWRSFGCSILDERAPDVPTMTQDQIDELAARPRIARQPVARKRSRQPAFVSLVSVSAASAESVIRVMQLEHCCPFQEVDSHKVEAIGRRGAQPIDRLVRLLRFAPSDVAPADSACREIGCDVLDERSPLDPGPSDNELANLADLPFDLRGREVRR